MIGDIHEHYVLPARTVRIGIAVLICSFFFNVITALFHVPYQRDLTKFDNSTTGEPIRLPVDVRRVALEVVDSDRYGVQDDNDWASVIPVGHGFVRLGPDYYAVSMYHQMHCLNSFRRMFTQARNESRAAHDAEHVLHCLTYLRQMVLCAADATLEPAFEAHNVDGRTTQAAYGTGVTHECRDWVQVREFTEANYEMYRDEESDRFAVTEISAIED
ncbi:hypothetical protein CERSUDRAFT_107019 [Gelatoporia subvermispora B]|uniref:Oxidase ustYa n=1 Tax=Ceriporiopsis subvermispora (strain B) TaxID=914234 RepID=M2PG77_CERS8|nr:hypothetical protein CERSUDRAFT_107019 [Gelatoporia subvermispora B]